MMALDKNGGLTNQTDGDHISKTIGVEYKAGASKPLYDLIIGKQTLHDIGAVLDFNS